MPGQGSTDRRLTSTLLAVTMLASSAVFGASNAGANPENPETAPPAAADTPPPEGFAPPPPPEDAPPPPADGFAPPPPADGFAPPPPADGFAPPPPPADAPPPGEAAPPPLPADAPPPEPAFWEAAPPPPPEAPEPEPPGALWAANVADGSQLLAPGVAPERGMQVKTILVARNISAVFPQINSMIGVRPDSQRWHPNGLAVDVMIPNSGSPEGIALGDQVVAYALANANQFALQDAIWRGHYYTPGGGARGGYGHYDHVHLTTFGGGQPNGGEQYPRTGGEIPPPPPPPAEDGPPPAPAAEPMPEPPPPGAAPPPEQRP